jgi:hypothetical protein
MKQISKNATVTIDLILWKDLLDHTEYDDMNLDLIVKLLMKGEFGIIKTKSDEHKTPISVTNVEVNQIADYWTED